MNTVRYSTLHKHTFVLITHERTNERVGTEVHYGLVQYNARLFVDSFWFLTLFSIRTNATRHIVVVVVGALAMTMVNANNDNQHLSPPATASFLVSLCTKKSDDFLILFCSFVLTAYRNPNKMVTIRSVSFCCVSLCCT